MSAVFHSSPPTYTLMSDALQGLEIDAFDLDQLRDNHLIERAADGRGSAWFIRLGDAQAVLRHYYRGGLAGKISRDRFVWTGAQRSRSFKEFALLEWMHDQGLPVPEPLAARVQHQGLLSRCDLITRAIPDTRTLAECLSERALDDALWRQCGVVIRQLHDHGVWHADLNAKNLLLDQSGAVYIIDFDRCRRRSGEGWKQENLARLQRSLLKLQSLGEISHFSADKWPLLVSAYVGQ